MSVKKVISILVIIVGYIALFWIFPYCMTDFNMAQTLFVEAVIHGIFAVSFSVSVAICYLGGVL